MTDYNWISSIPRSLGHTYASAAVVKALDGILVVSDYRKASSLERNFEVDTVTIQSAQTKLCGIHKPVIFDLQVVQGMALEISHLQESLRSAKEKLSSGGSR